MVVVSCRVDLDLPAHSLKEKRQILKSVLTRIRQHFNVAAAEVDLQDLWGSAAIGLVTVSSSTEYATGLLERAVEWIESSRLDVTIVSHEIEVY